MRLAIGSDTATDMTEALVAALETRGHKLFFFGPMKLGEAERDWPLVATDVARAVADGGVDEGILCCWTGTGVSIAANKIPGVRCALAGDAETARGARIFNHANVLALSLRATSIPLMREILEAWFTTSPASREAQSDWNREQVARVDALDSMR